MRKTGKKGWKKPERENQTEKTGQKNRKEKIRQKNRHGFGTKGKALSRLPAGFSVKCFYIRGFYIIRGFYLRGSDDVPSEWLLLQDDFFLI